MDIKDFASLIKAKRIMLDRLMRSRLPVIAGRMAKDHFQENFRKGGFVNGGLHLWQESRRLSSGRSGAASRYGTLLSRRNHLFRSITYTPGEYRVRVANEVAYAPIHNWGGTAAPTVTDRMRRFAWWKFYKASGKAKKAATGRKNARKRGDTAITDDPQAQFWKRLALTKKTKLSVKVPQRQFIGESRELTEAIRSRTEQEILKILNL